MQHSALRNTPLTLLFLHLQWRRIPLLPSRHDRSADRARWLLQRSAECEPKPAVPGAYLVSETLRKVYVRVRTSDRSTLSQ